MRKIKLFALFVSFLVGGMGCSEESDLLDENVEALLETRSVPVMVTYCWDAFVEVGEVSVYKGTTCRTYMAGGGGAPGGGITGGYEAGGFPSYGTAKDEGVGGNGPVFYVGDKWKFFFPELSTIYHPLSTLNVAEKSQFEHVMEVFDIMPSDYKKLRQKLVDKKIQIIFKVNPNSPYPALFKTVNNTIEFQDKSYISWVYFIEEFVHAVQYECYGDAMISALKNFEFEAKAFIDIVNVISDRFDENSDAVRYIPIQSDPNPVFCEKYESWIKSLRDKGYLTSSDYNTYYELCDLWSGAPGVCNPGLEPKLLREFFGKPRPPKYQRK